MANTEQVKVFIEKLAQLARNEYLNRKSWVLPSVCIAQAALETGWGTSGLMTKANAYFGIKASKSWSGKVYSSKTSECYDGFNYTTITGTFRAYGNVAESVKDYFDLITNNARYAGAVNNADAKSTITAIKNGGYATDPEYVNKIMSIIEAHDLRKYDDRPTTNVTTSAFKVGDKVVVKECKTYDGVSFSAYYSSYDVIQVNGNRIVIGIGNTVAGAFKDTSLAKAGSNASTKPVTTAPVTTSPFKVGDTVKVVNAVDYYGNPFKCWYRTYKVMEVKGDRVVIGYNGVVTAAINCSNICK